MSDFRQADGVASAAAASSLTLAWPLTTQNGSCLLAAVVVNGGTDIDISMPAGWTLVTAEVDRLTSVTIAIYKKENATSQSGNVVASFVLTGTSTATARFAELYLAEYPGMVTSGVVDKEASASGSSTSIALTGTPTTTQASETAFLLAAAANAPASSDLDTASATGGYTLVSHKTSPSNGTDRNSSAIFEKTLSATGTFDFSVPITGGISRAWCVKGVTLKKAAVAPPATSRDDGKLHKSVHLQEFGAIPNSAAAVALGVVDMMSGHIGMPGEANQYNGFADDLVAQAVAAGRTCEPMPYMKGVHYQIPSGLTFPESWYAHSGTPISSANRVHPGGFAGVFIMQPDSSAQWTDTGNAIGGGAGAKYNGWVAYQSQLIKHAVQFFNDQYAASDPCTGAWLDSIGSFSLNGQVNPSTGVAYTQSQWFAILNPYLAQLKAANPTITIIGNGIDSNPAIVGSANLDGSMSENWLRKPSAGALPTAGQTNAAWITDVQSAMDGQVAGTKKTQVYVKLWNNALTAAQEEDWRRAAAASYFLAQQGNLVLGLSSGTAVDPWTENYGPAWAVTLGTPRDTATASTWQNLTTAASPGYKLKADSAATGFVWRRRFASGCVFYNSAQNPIVVTLDRSDYLELDGTAAAVTYTVPAKKGVILTAPAVIAAPTNTVAPGAPTGTQTVGSTLTAQNGTWTGSPAFSYKWQRDTAGNGVFADIAGATSTTYPLAPADAGNKVRVVVTGTNAGGSLSVNSTATGLIAAGAAIPGNITQPTLSLQSPSAGQTITTTNGTWTNSPTSFTYQWQQVDPNTLSATNIVGATASSYDILDADTGFLLRCKVTAVNAAGSSTSNSNPTDVVAPRPPAVPTNTVAPAAPTGTTTVGSVLTADNGTWTGSPTFTYQWQQVDPNTLIATDIVGATAAAYTLVDTDEGMLIVVEVTGSNAGGQGDTATSAPTGAITNPSSAPPVTPTTTATSPEYRYILCGRDGTPLGAPLNALTARQITFAHLAPTVAVFTASALEPLLQQIVEGFTRLKIYREDDLIFHGRIWDVDDDLQGAGSERTTVTAMDPLFTLSLTPMAAALSLAEAVLDQDTLFKWGNQPIFSIVQQVIDYFSGFQSDDGPVSGYHPGEMKIGARLGSSPNVSRSSRSSDTMLDWLTTQLAHVDNGIEWICRPVEGTVARYDVNDGFDGPPKLRDIEQIAALDLYYPNTGAAQPLTLGYGTGPSNLSSVKQASPGSQIINWAVAAGGGNGNHPLARQAHDVASINDRGILFSQDAQGDIGNPTTLSQRAKFLLQPKPLRALTVVPKPGSFRLFDDLVVGDTVNCAISRGRVQRFDRQRVYGATLSLSDTDGTEQLDSITIGDLLGAKAPRKAEDRLTDEIVHHRRRIRRLEHFTPVTDAYVDEGGGGQQRVRSGLQEDGSWGVRVWNTNGALIFDQTAP